MFKVGDKVKFLGLNGEKNQTYGKGGAKAGDLGTVVALSGSNITHVVMINTGRTYLCYEYELRLVKSNDSDENNEQIEVVKSNLLQAYRTYLKALSAQKIDDAVEEFSEALDTDRAV